MMKPRAWKIGARWLGCVSIFVAVRAGAAPLLASSVPAQGAGSSPSAAPSPAPDAAADPAAGKPGAPSPDDAFLQSPRTERINSADLEAWAAFGGDFAGPKGNIERYYSQVSEKAAETLRRLAAQRAATEEAAGKAAEDVRIRADAARRGITSGPADPDDSPELAAEKRRALLAAFDARTDAMVKTARQKVLDDARASQRYTDSAQAEADLKATLAALYARVDAAYTDAIAKAIDKLNAEYELPGSARRGAAEAMSGYAGRYYKVERVNRYFNENWKGDMEPLAIETCKSALGFKMGGDGGNFKDPSVENVDKICGVREGLIALLVSYKGSNKLTVRRK